MGCLERAGFLFLVLAACGGTNSGTGGDDMQPMPDAPDQTAGTWSTLIDKNWSLPPQGENENDLQIVTLERDIYVGGIRPIAPVGTHHTLLFRGLQGTNAIYASGVGTGELMFPAGKGFKFTKGTALGLQLHVFNTGDDTLTGLSGVEILEVDPATVTEEVDLFLPGPKDGGLVIPPNVSTQSGTCTVSGTQHLFALFPHMHQWGVHLKTTLTIGGVEQVLHDDDYTFEHQIVKTFTPITLNAGDKVKTECTYNNTTGATITYGESSNTEMCYSILYRYPKQSQEFCTN